MPAETYDGGGVEVSKGDLWAVGTVKPDSSLEDASVAAGIPAASLDIFYGQDSRAASQGRHVDLGIAPESYDGK